MQLGGSESALVGEAAPMEDAVAAMSAKRFGCVGVVDAAGRLAGIVTDGDMRRRFGKIWRGAPSSR